MATGAAERLTGDDLLSFAGIAPAQALAVPHSQQFAEKLHAYTLPRQNRINTRAKDLVDLVLLIETEELDFDTLFQSVEATFSRRGTHPVPKDLPPPPGSWDEDLRAWQTRRNSVRELWTPALLYCGNFGITMDDAQSL